MQNVGASFFITKRGGQVTYHGPGQLVGYPILDLNNMEVGLGLSVRQDSMTILRSRAGGRACCPSQLDAVADLQTPTKCYVDWLQGILADYVRDQGCEGILAPHPDGHVGVFASPTEKVRSPPSLRSSQ